MAPQKLGIYMLLEKNSELRIFKDAVILVIRHWLIYSAIDQYADLDKGELKDKVDEIARFHIHEMYRYLDILNTISVATPLFGLLGTVLGMIGVFEQIYLAGVEDAPLLAGGISQALVSTAAGLSVAIPALLFHRF